MARICRLYGVNPLAGRLYAILFLSPLPLSLDELCARTGAAKSTLSVALRRLLGWRVVRRLPPRGDRRDYYEAVGDPWVVLADCNRHYLQPELQMWRESGAQLERALGSAPDAPQGADRTILEERLANLNDFMELFARLLAQVLGAEPDRPRSRAIAIELEEQPL